MTSTQIGIDHCTIGHDFLRVAVGENDARVHTDKPLSDLEQDVNDMLDPYNRDFALA